MQTVVRAWESFQCGDPEPSGVRPEVLRSWRRSRWSGVDPERHAVVEAVPRGDGSLIDLAAPILRAVADPIAGDRTAVTLADPSGVCIWRWSSSAAMTRLLDAVDARENILWTESVAGTCGAGTALDQLRPTTVVGAEHFSTVLHDWACSAAPVLHPITGRVCGIVNISVRAVDANPHLELVVRSMAVAVAAALRDAASSRERRLLDAYLRWRSRTRKPLVALDGDLVIADETPVSHDRLWAAVREAGPEATTLVLDGGVTARIHPVEPGRVDAGVVLVVEPDGPPVAPVTPAPDPEPGDHLTPLERAELAVIVEALDRHGGNKVRTAQEIGLSRRALYDKLRRYRIRR